MYGAGANDYGQLGDGTTTSRSTPVQFILPPGKIAKSVGVNGFTTFVLTTDDNVYAAGLCGNGRLGTNYTIAGCANRTTAARVNLPTPNASQLNTIPTTNIVSDSSTTYIRMQGGQVWGWGGNENTQLGNGNTTDSSNPAKLGVFGDAGQPKAIDVQTDGISVWIVDDTGKVWAAGDNKFGQLGGGGTVLKLESIGKCLDDKSGLGTNVQFWTCNDTTSQDWTWRSDKSIYNATTGKCVNVMADLSAMNLAACTGTNYQKFILRDDTTIQNVQTSKCLNNKANDGITVIVFTCVANANEYFSLPNVKKFSSVPIPSSSGTAVKVATDQWFTAIMTSTGEVYTFGVNNRGQLGNGTITYHQPFPTKFILPAGVTAKDVYIGASAVIAVGARNNTFVIGSDGKVYGAGSNGQGQLGDGTTTDRATPVAMLAIDGVNVRAKSVATGHGTTIVITEDKRVFTVGANENGQLGDGTTTNSSIPKANRYTNVLPVTSF